VNHLYCLFTSSHPTNRSPNPSHIYSPSPILSFHPQTLHLRDDRTTSLATLTFPYPHPLPSYPKETHIPISNPKNGQTSFRSVLNRADDGGAVVRGPIIPNLLPERKGPDICIVPHHPNISHSPNDHPLPPNPISPPHSLTFSPLPIFSNRTDCENP
jgi:hypothetical protein